MGRRPSAPLPAFVTGGQIAGLIGRTERAVRSRIAQGHVPVDADGRVDLAALVRAGIDAVAAQTRTATEGSDTLSLTVERARLARAQADAAELRLARERGEVLDAAEAARTWAGFCRDLRARLLAVPSRVRQRLPHLTRADVEAIDGEVREALTELGGGGGA